MRLNEQSCSPIASSLSWAGGHGRHCANRVPDDRPKSPAADSRGAHGSCGCGCGAGTRPVIGQTKMRICMSQWQCDWSISCGCCLGTESLPSFHILATFYRASTPLDYARHGLPMVLVTCGPLPRLSHAQPSEKGLQNPRHGLKSAVPCPTGLQIGVPPAACTGSISSSDFKELRHMLQHFTQICTSHHQTSNSYCKQIGTLW